VSPVDQPWGERLAYVQSAQMVRRYLREAGVFEDDAPQALL
jgi:hypothetical protein